MAKRRQFEYALEPTPGRFESAAEIEMFLNEQGYEGWELCAIDYGCFILKREILE